MNLPGRLQATTLGDLIGTLHRAQVSGVLELEEPGLGARVHRVYFDRGLVDRVETSLPGPRIGEVLSSSGALSRDELLQLSRRLAAEPQRRAGEILSELIDAGALASGLRRQLRLRLEALFDLSDAHVRFHVRGPRSELTDAPLPLHPADFLRGRPRARERAGALDGRAAERAQARRRAWAVLGVPAGADAQAVQRAFRRLAAEAHPDRHPQASPEQRSQLLKRFAELSSAYHTLQG